MWRLCMLACLLAGCGTAGPVLGDGAVDSASLGDGALLDAAVDAALLDAEVDAALPDGGSPDAGESCSVAGRPGECLATAECSGDRESTPGLCSGPADIQCCAPPPVGGACDPVVMPQPNEGLLTEAPGDVGCPAGMASLGAYCIDRYEGSLALLAFDGTLAPWSPFFPPEGVRVRALSVAGVVPQGYITGVQAAAACAEAGKRQCTDDEWLGACRGAASRVYPYGSVRVDGQCNDARAAHPVVEYFGTGADWIWSMLGHPCINQLPVSLARTGTHDACVTPEGVYDLMGNLHEWTAAPAGTFRGGFYVDTVLNGEGCLYRTTAHSRGHWDYSTGFRCCADSE